ncbi:MAG: aminotransferase class IV [Desulfitobacterium sp.]
MGGRCSLGKLNQNDRLALFGYGLFETLRGKAEQLEYPLLHYRRMLLGAQVLGLSMPDYEDWYAGLVEYILSEKPSSDYALRVTLSGGAGREVPPQWFYQLRAIPYTESDYSEGLPITVLRTPRNEYSPLVKIKSTNYMENILAKKEAEQKGAREGIWLNTKGYLVEGTMSNLFMIKEGVLYTPALTCGCLPGTRREVVLSCAGALGIPCVEGEFGVQLLQDAEEVFLTNSLMGIMPVSQVDQCKIPLKIISADSVRMRIQNIYNI